jgi:hypothetical protein
MHDAGDTGRTRADTPPNPSRRGLLAGSTAAALVATTAVVTAVAAPGAILPDWPHADAYPGADDHLLRLSIIANGSEPPDRGRALMLVADEAMRLAALEPVDPAGPDAELISLCNRLAEHAAAERTMIMAQHTIEDELRIEPALDAVGDEQKAILDRITELPEPVTLAGARAMARAAISQAPLELDGSISFMGDAEWLAFGVAEFLVGEQDRQGRTTA